MKTFTNEDVAKILRNVAAAYTIQNEAKYRFQILAYQKAADSIEATTTEIKDLIKDNALDKLDGVGTSIKGHISELFEKGHLQYFDSILEKVSPAVFPLLDIPSFGPKKAFKIVNAFNLSEPKSVINDVYKLGKEGKIAPLDGFGEKSQSDIIRAIDEYKIGKTKSARMILATANEISNTMLTYLKKDKSVLQAYTLGSLRRMKSTTGDIDIAVSSNNPTAVLDHFNAYPYKDRIIERGDITSSIILSGNKQIDLMVLKPEMMGSLLQHFTGSKEHNVHLREYALKKGFSLSEKGIKMRDGTLKTFDNEEKFYNFLGLDFVPPELRENQGEIEAAIAHKLPKLVDLKDIKGDFHIHSNYPVEPSHDLGHDSMQKMIDRAVELNYEYIGFSEHNPSVGNHTNEQIFSILQKRLEKIEQLRMNNKNIHIINLLEIDILANGNLALDDKSLELIDMAIVSIHSSFKTPKEEMTKRILSGLSHPKAKIFAHPSGRLINSRNPYEVVWKKLFTYVLQNNKALEINSWPTRLDLPDTLVKEAKEMGIRFVIDTDSHAVSHMENMPYGVAVARRGWCEKKDILNTLPYGKLAEWIAS
jgi:DNA polymerase (family 10)